MFQTLTPAKFEELLANSDYSLIDLRTPDEQKKYGVIRDDQLHIEYSLLFFRSKLSDLDRSKKYLIYCWHGKRSLVSRQIMQEMGFEWVCDLKGGIDEWNKDETNSPKV